MTDANETRGKVKETVGKATGDRDLERQGNSEQAKAKVGKAADKVKDAAKKAKDAVTPS